MIIEIKVPSPGESITEVEISRWLVPDGSQVAKGQEIAEVESDKATLTIVADSSGKLSIVAKEGQTVVVGTVAALIDTEAIGSVIAAQSVERRAESAESKAESGERRAESVELVAQGMRSETSPDQSGEQGVQSTGHRAQSTEHRAQGTRSEASPDQSGEHGVQSTEHGAPVQLKITAVGREIMKEHQLSVDELISGLKRIGRKEVEEVLQLRKDEDIPVSPHSEPSREIVKDRMTVLRRKLGERLVSVKNETAMLTTFNEVDMSAVMELRTRFQKKFSEKHGLKLGFMAFFTKAVAIAAQIHPSVNAMIDGEELLFPQYVDVGIAVQTPKGLMVPVVRNAESKSIPQIEKEIRDLAEKARSKKISIEELSGGTFTITNGGVFGSLLSTPIINPPQSAILGMHNIVERPVAIQGKVEIRPMMYIALSYDHRVIDGKDSVGFLVKVKEMIENPGRMFAWGKDPVEILLEI
jgi:2-oxoglutarate dehydrogenase E2 component (dihydrolipoamide succinyltransferase)